MKKINTQTKNLYKNVKIKIGTVDKKTPSIIYIEGSMNITPTIENYKEYTNYKDSINKIYKSFNKNILNHNNKLINDSTNNPYFENKIIFDFDVPVERISYGKKSNVSFNIFLKQKELIPFNSIKENAKTLITNIIDDVITNFNDYDFNICE